MRNALEHLIAGDIPFVLAGREELPSDPILLSGSFNPLHKGHVLLLAAAEQVSERKGILELSITNVDKAPLEIDEIERRVACIEQHIGILITSAPTFAEKAELLPGAWFALGYDTAIRLLDPAYNNDIPAMLARFDELRTRFVVAGRLHAGEFLPPEQIEIPEGFEHLFISIPESVFREDISSTELRRRIGS